MILSFSWSTSGKRILAFCSVHQVFFEFYGVHHKTTPWKEKMASYYNLKSLLRGIKCDTNEEEGSFLRKMLHFIWILCKTHKKLKFFWALWAPEMHILLNIPPKKSCHPPILAFRRIFTRASVYFFGHFLSNPPFENPNFLGGVIIHPYKVFHLSSLY